MGVTHCPKCGGRLVASDEGTPDEVVYCEENSDHYRTDVAAPEVSVPLCPKCGEEPGDYGDVPGIDEGRLGERCFNLLLASIR